MLNREEHTTIRAILGGVAEGLQEVVSHPEYSSLMASSASGSVVTTMANRFGLTPEVLVALQTRLDEEFEGVLTAVKVSEAAEPFVRVDQAVDGSVYIDLSDAQKKAIVEAGKVSNE